MAVALVLEEGGLAEDRESVGETLGDEELEMVFVAEFDSKMAAVGGRSLPYVHSHIENPALDASDKFRLCIRRFLEMESPDHTVA